MEIEEQHRPIDGNCPKGEDLDVIRKDDFCRKTSLKSLDVFLSVEQCESALNQFIDFITKNGGQIWLQDSNNKEFIIKLDRKFNLNYYYPECVKFSSEDKLCQSYKV